MKSIDNLSGSELTKVYNEVLSFILDRLTDEKGKRFSQARIGKEIRESETNISRSKDSSNEADPSTQKRILKKLLGHFPVILDAKTGKARLQKMEEKRELEELAAKLAINLIDVSTDFHEVKEPHQQILVRQDVKKKIIDDWRLRERFIAITGAGATFAATRGFIPMGNEGIKIIKEKSSIDNALISEELDRLEQIYRLDKDSFETQLLAISKFSRKGVIKVLKEICDHQNIPSLTYEILAHMLKHRFFDGIINYNYDQVLDVAIEEEIFDGDYKFIFSDGDCPESFDELLNDNRLKQPIYIKPHGTIKHESSLRFTQEDYYTTPVLLRNTIEKLLNGKVDSRVQEKLPLNLIVIGYCIKSAEFSFLLKRYFDQNPDSTVKIWVFDIVDYSEQLLRSLGKEYEDRLKIIHFSKYLPGDEYYLDDYLETLWNLIEQNFVYKFKPRGIERHSLINHVFQPDQTWLSQLDSDPDCQKNYFKDRFLIELVISLLQSDGLLHARQIMEDRSGKYFNLYKKSMKDTNIQVSLRGECQNFGLKIYKGFVGDTFTLQDPILFYSLDDNDKENLFHYLYDLLKENLSKRQKKNIKHEEGKKKFLDLASKIRRRNVSKITPNYRYPHGHLFSFVKESDVLNTPTGWIYRFQNTVNKSNKWDLLLAISEKGRFLNSIDKENLKNKKVELVVASFDLPGFPDMNSRREKDLNEQINWLSGNIQYLPWWLHNRHMVLFLKRKKNANHFKNEIDKWDFYAGFYYESRLLSRRVNPVFIRHQEDLKLMLYDFVNYWHRARTYTKNKNNPDIQENFVPIISDQDSLDQYIEELLCHWEKD